MKRGGGKKRRGRKGGTKKYISVPLATVKQYRLSRNIIQNTDRSLQTQSVILSWTQELFQNLRSDNFRSYFLRWPPGPTLKSTDQESKVRRAEVKGPGQGHPGRKQPGPIASHAVAPKGQGTTRVPQARVGSERPPWPPRSLSQASA